VKVFVAGASGALGAQSVPNLVAAGHQVVAMTKTESKQDGLLSLGARPLSATLSILMRWPELWETPSPT
jgi:nucleoside-diphosphate-sugar epimerase